MYPLGSCFLTEVNICEASFPQARASLSSPAGCLPKNDVMSATVPLMTVQQSFCVLCVATSLSVKVLLSSFGAEGRV